MNAAIHRVMPPVSSGLLAAASPSATVPDASSSATGAIGAVLAFALVAILLAIVVALLLTLGRTNAETAVLEPEVVSDATIAPAGEVGFPTYDARYGGFGTELVKRFELRQVGKTLDRHLAVNEQSLRLVKQLEALETGKAAILTERYRQRLAPAEFELRLEEIAAQSREIKARLARADLAVAQAVHEKDGLESPIPPPRRPSPAQQARREAKERAAKVERDLAVLANLERARRKALAKATPEERAFLKAAFRKVRDEVMDGL